MARAKKKAAPKEKPTLVGQRKMGWVLITGASAGIGAELAREFSSHAHDLVLVARSKDKLDALAGELNAAHDTKTIVISADLSASDQLVGVVEELQNRDIDIDILVNNAGIIDVGPFADAAPEKLQQLIALNIAAATALTSLLLPSMIERKFGRILNVASLAGFQPIPSMAVYAASKAYVLSLTESLAEELRGTGVKVTALCPGMTDTSMVTTIKAQSKTAQWTPSFLISNPKTVAKQAYKALMAGQTILVPGLPNQVAAAWAQVTPRWLTRTVTGFAARRTDWMKSGD
ncbi:MAG: SDR family oxidoreductase [Alphaproteobacteria bacterium]|nr:SDR family oxidoreductase [Alphaproteobacteria bacterium]